MAFHTLVVYVKQDPIVHILRRRWKRKREPQFQIALETNVSVYLRGARAEAMHNAGPFGICVLTKKKRQSTLTKRA